MEHKKHYNTRSQWVVDGNDGLNKENSHSRCFAGWTVKHLSSGTHRSFFKNIFLLNLP